MIPRCSQTGTLFGYNSSQSITTSTKYQNKYSSAYFGSTLSESSKVKDNLSFVKGPPQPELIDETIGEVLDRQVRDNGDTLAVIDAAEDIKWTYKQLGEIVAQLCYGLNKLGVQPGDKVGIYMPNCAIWLGFQYALGKIGAILVCLNPSYKELDLSQVMKLSELNYLVTTSRFKKSDYLATITELIPELKESPYWRSSTFPHLKGIIVAPLGESLGEPLAMLPKCFIQYRDLLGSSGTINNQTQAHEVINLQFTSGTTGTPKGVCLTHHNIMNNGLMIADRQRLTKLDIVCIPVPLFHCFGLVIGNLACLSVGATVLYPSPLFSPIATLEAVAKYQATSLYGVPTMFIAMLNHPEFSSFDLTSLRTGVMAGSTCPAPVMERVITELGMRDVTICYGMTETSPVSFMTSTGSSMYKQTKTVGKIMPHTQAKIKQNGQDVSLGQVGSLFIKGYLVMNGYWKDSKATELAIKDGWMDTGDLAVFEEDGSCRIVGRAKDMVIRGGENLYPFEIESHFLHHPLIHDIAIVGVPDSHFGEELCAFVIPKSPSISPSKLEATLRDHFKQKLAHFKIPRYFLIVDRFPSTLSGKVIKHVLRDEAITKLQLKSP